VSAVRLRPVDEDDLAMFRRFATEPGLVGPDWAGFRDAQAPARRFAVDGYLGADDGRLVVEVDGHEAAGFVRACEFRAGQWRDGYLYSRLRDDPAPPL
jgi:[ribosomal protein S5]-alanine N-acetyltransferase